MKGFELVVARHNELLNWLQRIPKNLGARVYDKSGEPTQHTPLPNLGREAHTYLHHIVTHYHELAGVTVFCQGRPFDHVPDFQRRLRQLLDGAETVDGFRWLGFIIDVDDTTGSRLFQNWSKNPKREPLDMVEFWDELWDEALPDRFPFYLGAHFMVTADQVRTRSLAFYEKALELSASFPHAAHCFERCWDKVFGANGIPAEFRDAKMPVYLRPIKKLGLTWEQVPEEHRGW